MMTFPKKKLLTSNSHLRTIPSINLPCMFCFVFLVVQFLRFAFTHQSAAYSGWGGVQDETVRLLLAKGDIAARGGPLVVDLQAHIGAGRPQWQLQVLTRILTQTGRALLIHWILFRFFMTLSSVLPASETSVIVVPLILI